MHAGRVRLDRAALVLDAHAHVRAPRLDERRQFVDDAPDDGPEMDRRESGHLLPCIEPRQPQQVGDEPLHARRVAEDDLQELARLTVRALLEQRLDVAADRGQRRAQFVRDVADEVAPHLVRAL